jgi:hypothetical protein
MLRRSAAPQTMDPLNFHTSGTFSTADPTQITRFLAQRFGLVVHDNDGEMRLSHDYGE